jgi:predicted AAA+ superfamily ATPase
VITGSTRRDAPSRTAQALTGRLHSLTIWPLSQGEIGEVIQGLLSALRTDPNAVVAVAVAVAVAA